MRLARYRGEALVRLGDARGIPLLEAAVQASPDSLDAAESLARALAPVEPHRAAELYRRLVVAAPYDPRLRYDLGCVLIGIDAAAAEQELREAIRLNPTSDAALNNLASLLFAAGRLEEAIVAYRRCLEVNPQHPLAGANLRAAEAALRAREGG
jgi:Flp pilus assembly protein TadD